MKEVLFVFLLILSGGELWGEGHSAKTSCKTCKKFVTDFGKGFDGTANSNFAGGDTSWEEEKLGLYSNSEVRLVEILDAVCERSDYKCNRLLEEAEEDIERWWFKLRKMEGKSDLKTWLCDNHLDVCCPENTFGPSCQSCPGGPDNVCGGRGKCEGSEEKDDDGKCVCDSGYTGDVCLSCADKYYHEADDDDDDDDDSNGGGGDGDGDDDEITEPPKLECQACDKSCDQSCDGPGAGDCDSCAEGYTESEDGVCEDFDECKSDGDTKCKEGTYCYNTPGSHRCNDCDKSCKKICNGPGPSKCAECANGYTRNEHGVCRDDDECSVEGSSKCQDGTYCENTPGKYACKACHISCLSGCHGPGSKGCVACKDGYTMSEEDECTDNDECAATDSEGPCDPETEVCHNLIGTYVCHCKGDLVKGEEGKCVEEEVRKKQRKEKKEKEKKKRRKKKKKAIKANLSEGEKEGEKEVRVEEEGHKEARHREHILRDDEGVGVVVDGGVANSDGMVNGAAGLLDDGVGVVDSMGVVYDGGVVNGDMMDEGDNWKGGVVSEKGDGGGGVVSDDIIAEQESHEEL